MPFRDELEAARARIHALEQHAARARDKEREPPFVMVSVLLLGAVLALGAGMAVMWQRIESAEAEAAQWRQMEGETAFQLSETLGRLNDAQRGSTVEQRTR